MRNDTKSRLCDELWIRIATVLNGADLFRFGQVDLK